MNLQALAELIHASARQDKCSPQDVHILIHNWLRKEVFPIKKKKPASKPKDKEIKGR